ncbi:MAG: Hpt domain-containing protein [Proteobacteria bacterium]|nr:Hpt domain-containing protein [Pseudomonadota bacterium]
MDELLSEFLTEANESLAELDNGMVRLEQNPNDPELLSEIFRVVHTIKGTCASFTPSRRISRHRYRACHGVPRRASRRSGSSPP